MIIYSLRPITGLRGFAILAEAAYMTELVTMRRNRQLNSNILSFFAQILCSSYFNYSYLNLAEENCVAALYIIGCSRTI